MNTSVDTEQIIARLKSEFIDESLDSLDKIDKKSLSHNAVNTQEVMRVIHSIKGQAATYGFSTVSLVAHLLESSLQAGSDQKQDYIRLYVSWMRKILEKGHDPDSETTQGIISELIRGDYPTRRRHQGVVINATPLATTGRICSEIAIALGFHALSTRSEFEALALAVQMQPRVLILARQLNFLTAGELMGVITRIRRLAKLPVIIVSGSGAPIEAVDNLRPTQVVRVSAQLNDDLAAALDAAAALSPAEPA